MPPDVLSAGIIVADYVCNPIPYLPGEGELVLTDRILLTIGGCAATSPSIWPGWRCPPPWSAASAATWPAGS